MSLVTVEGLSLAFAGRTLFDQVGFAIAAGDRVGLVGRNGMGKTSLLRTIISELQPDAGLVRLARGLRIGHLPQEVAAPSPQRLLASVLESVPGLAQVEAEMAQIGAELEASTDETAQTELALRFGELQEQHDHYEVCFAPHEAERILAGLGFTRADFERPLAELSGGWRMRAALAALLFQQPDVLLLDEPTNHLDLPSVRWFDGFLKKFTGAFLLVSHDREFLNRQIERVISLELEGLRAYAGNYDHYVQLRDEEDAVLKNRAKNVERERRDIERFVTRFKAKPTKARAASSKAKVLRKMAKIERLELPRELRFNFPEAPASGRQVLHLDSIGKYFGDNVLYQDLNLSLYRGDRIALVGSNGSGKTTLLRIVVDELPADGGEVRLGHQVTLGFYAQHCAEQLHPKLNILQTLWNEVPALSQTYVRTVLGTFLFSGDDALKPVGVLSGGERARVALAKLVAHPTNFLVMDEPTSHLDLNATEALAEAMIGYPGAVLFVSHNLSLLRSVATKIWDLRDGQVHEYLGGYDGYAASRERELAASTRSERELAASTRSERELAASTRSEQVPAAATVEIARAPAAEQHPADEEESAAPARNRSDQKTRKRAQARRRQELSRRLGSIPQRITELERRIEKLEQGQANREKELALPEIFDDQLRYQALLREYTEGQEKLDELVARWEGLEEERERITAKVEATTAEDEG